MPPVPGHGLWLVFFFFPLQRSKIELDQPHYLFLFSSCPRTPIWENIGQDSRSWAEWNSWAPKWSIYELNLILKVPFCCCCSVWLFGTPWTAACQAFLSFTISQNLLKLMSIESVMPSNRLVLSLPSPPAFNLSQHQSFLMSQLFASGGQNIGASASASVVPTNIQGWFLWDWLFWSPCSPRDSHESSQTPQFESIKSSAFFRVQSSLTSGIN